MQTERAFWEAVEIGEPDQCWIWKEQRPDGRYGQTWWDGKIQGAHRAAWQIRNGEIPKDKPYILHSCHNPPCCNPNHLRPGTNSENMVERHESGRDNSYWAKKTHCPQNHEYTPENTIQWGSKGGRRCRTCETTRNLKRREQSNAKARERYRARKFTG